jgi:phosphopantothenoylcysteine decarboxylase/phosphopantothenate--cysteine ligase
MGISMAQAAQKLGADVTLIHGPLSVPIPDGIHTEKIVSAADLFEVVQNYQNADVIIMAAAVSDFTPANVYDQKVKKSDGEDSIPLKKTQDILAWLGEQKKESQTLIGFAMETEDLIKNATQKLERKNADFIIANSLSEKGSGFESDTNKVHLLSTDSDKSFEGPKQDIAIEILNTIFR